jgi:hypothetical protein
MSNSFMMLRQVADGNIALVSVRCQCAPWQAEAAIEGLRYISGVFTA